MADHLDRYVPAARTEYDAQFAAGLDSLREPFGASIGRTIPTTQPAPATVDIFASQRSPIVHLMSKPASFVNVPGEGIHFALRETKTKDGMEIPLEIQCVK